jgi:hypothetical protein
MHNMHVCNAYIYAGNQTWTADGTIHGNLPIEFNVTLGYSPSSVMSTSRRHTIRATEPSPSSDFVKATLSRGETFRSCLLLISNLSVCVTGTQLGALTHTLVSAGIVNVKVPTFHWADMIVFKR